MPHESDHSSPDDIQQALSAAQHLESSASAQGEPLSVADTLVQGESRSAWGHLRYAVMKCGLMAETYPWQTTALLCGTIGCGWVCAYFGWTVFAALVAFAVSRPD